MTKQFESIVVTMTGPAGGLSTTVKGTAFVGTLDGAPEMLTEGEPVSLTLRRRGASASGEEISLTGCVRWLVADGEEIEHAYVDAGVVFRFDAAEGDDTDASVVADAAGGRMPSRVYRRPFPLITALDALDEDATVLGPAPDAATVLLASEEEILREPSGVIGTLRQVSLAEVVQGLEMGRKTARVDISAPDNTRGRLFLDGGALIHAEHEEARGLEAFFALAALNAGAYRVRFGRVTKERTIADPTAYVVLEAMRRLDEAEYESGLPVAAESGGEDFADTGARERAFLSLEESAALVPEQTAFDNTRPQDAATVEAALPSVDKLFAPPVKATPAPAPTVRVKVSGSSGAVELPPPLPVEAEGEFNEIDDDQVLTEADADELGLEILEEHTETTTHPRTRKDQPPLKQARVFGGFFQEAVSGDDDLDTKLSDSLAFIGDSGAHDRDGEVEITNA